MLSCVFFPFILFYFFEEEDEVLGLLLEFDFCCYCPIIQTYSFNYINNFFGFAPSSSRREGIFIGRIYASRFEW